MSEEKKKIKVVGAVTRYGNYLSIVGTLSEVRTHLKVSALLAKTEPYMILDVLDEDNTVHTVSFLNDPPIIMQIGEEREEVLGESKSKSEAHVSLSPSE